jgi:conjugal transfer pilus assembly protein TraF
MRWPFLIPVFATSILLAAGSACAEKRTPAPSSWAAQPATEASTPESSSSNRWIGDRERGWHWYEIEPTPPPPVDPLIPEGQGSAPQPAPPAWSSAWLREELPKALERAVDAPTAENIAYHSLLQRVAMERAEKFATASVETNALNPVLDSTVDDPVSTFARANLEIVGSEQRAEILSRLADEIGIWYFYSSTCQFCMRLNNALRTFLDRHPSFSILPISMDRLPMRDGSFPNWVPDSGQAQALGVAQTPTLFVFRPPRKLLMLGVGVLSTPDLEKKLLQIARREQWISDEEYNRVIQGKSRNFLVEQLQSMPGIDWKDPAQTMAAITAMNVYGKQSEELDEHLLDNSAAAMSTPIATEGASP